MEVGWFEMWSKVPVYETDFVWRVERNKIFVHYLKIQAAVVDLDLSHYDLS